jgi:hypothetical protein
MAWLAPDPVLAHRDVLLDATTMCPGGGQRSLPRDPDPLAFSASLRILWLAAIQDRGLVSLDATTPVATFRPHRPLQVPVHYTRFVLTRVGDGRGVFPRHSPPAGR